MLLSHVAGSTDQVISDVSRNHVTIVLDFACVDFLDFTSANAIRVMFMFDGCFFFLVKHRPTWQGGGGGRGTPQLFISFDKTLLFLLCD